MIDAVEISAEEGTGDRLAGAGVVRHFDQKVVAEAKPGSGPDRCPLDALRGDVFTGGARIDPVSFRLERLNDLQGEEAQRLLWRTVVPLVPLVVDGDAPRTDRCLWQRQLGDTPARGVDLVNGTEH